MAKALAAVEQQDDIARNGPKGVLRGVVATCVKAGMPPEKTFAVIKTVCTQHHSNSEGDRGDEVYAESNTKLSFGVAGQFQITA